MIRPRTSWVLAVYLAVTRRASSGFIPSTLMAKVVNGQPLPSSPQKAVEGKELRKLASDVGQKVIKPAALMAAVALPMVLCPVAAAGLPVAASASLAASRIAAVFMPIVLRVPDN
ncbi:unnamed protein product, partial [Pylaiella littoralis]